MHLRFRKHLRRFIVFIFCLKLFSSCVFNKFIYTDAELKERYQLKKIQPEFHVAHYKNYHMHYAEFGNDSLPMLVLIHGAPGSWYGYLNFTDNDSLLKHYHIISVDRLGYGKSGYGKTVPDLEAQALAVKAVIEQQEHKDSVTIVGRSYGAPVGAYLASKYPNMIHRMLMVSPVIHPYKEKFYWFSPLGKLWLTRWILPDFMNVASDEKYLHAPEMRKHTGMWANVKCPTTVISGGKDWIADPSNYSFADSVLVNCPKHMIMIPDAGHYLTGQRGDFIIHLLLNKEDYQTSQL